MPKAADTKVKNVYFSPDEWERIRDKAFLADLKVGTFIRKAALECVVKRYDLQSVRELTAEINHYGTLLNQVARTVNETHCVCQSDMEQIQNIWKRFLVTINNLIYEDLKYEELTSVPEKDENG